MELPEVVIMDDLLELGIYRARQTVHAHVRDGILPRPRMLNNRYIWSRAQIKTFLASDKGKRIYPRTK
ncbi:hypothetical protein [Roseomonas fluvialis]|uniref:DNA-binding protein n=1 Tax=Roseomonas fluvialis TaxID=1750527 RepID=A0ABM7Y2F5_9PROT|nr:hypothetical protein [Roseomonas fluvialis]BDG71985.1 hypothetical protein Rmf_19140 [Roseomonas fluvialis]